MRPSPRFRGLGPRPRTIVFGNVKSLQFLPGLHRLFSRGAFLPGQEVAHEVDVSVVRDMSKRLPGLIESNVFFDQVSVVEPDALDELRFPPTVEPVAHAGFSRQAWSQFLSLFIEEILGFRVVRVDHHGKVEAQPSFAVFGAWGREVSCGRALDLTGFKKELDSLLEFVFAQLVSGWDPDGISKFLELDCVPIAIVELGHSHQRR